MLYPQVWVASWAAWLRESHLVCISVPRRGNATFCWVQTRSRRTASVCHASRGQHLTSTMKKTSQVPINSGLEGRPEGGSRCEPSRNPSAPLRRLQQRCHMSSPTTGAGANQTPQLICTALCCLSEPETHCPGRRDQPSSAVSAVCWAPGEGDVGSWP